MSDLGAPTTKVPVAHECEIVSEHVGPVCVVHVEGPLDWASAAQFHDRMCDEYTDPTVIVDLSHSVRMDSAGTGALLGAVAEALKRGQQLVVVSADEVEVDVLRCLQLDLTVPIFSSQIDALSWLDNHDPIS
jgi:anti-anti-sigma factor